MSGHAGSTRCDAKRHYAQDHFVPTIIGALSAANFALGFAIRSKWDMAPGKTAHVAWACFAWIASRQPVAHSQELAPPTEPTTEGRTEGPTNPPRQSPETLSPPTVISIPSIEPAPQPPISRQEFVVLNLLIDTHGAVQEVEIVEASREDLGPLVEQALMAAQFAPARQGDVPVAARIRYRYVFDIVRVPMTPPSDITFEDTPGTHNRDGVNETPPAVIPDPEEYTATAEAPPPEPGGRHLTLEEMRELPGALGDPFRAIDILPGVTPVLTGLPYFYIRGAPPNGNAFYFDNIPVPSLFHFGIGAAVIHPRMIDAVDVHNGIAPARYGRHFGAVIAGQAPSLRITRPRAEAELRAIDVSGYIETPLTPDWTVQGAVRIGYPAYLISLFAPGVSLSYWDYQARSNLRISAVDQIELVTFGSFDEFTQTSEGGDRSFARLFFIRNELRLIRRQDGWELGAAFRLGYEESSGGGTDQSVSIGTTTMGPRLWFNTRRLLPFELRSGVELMGSFGRADFGSDADFGEISSAVPESASALGAARVSGNVFAETRFRPTEAITLDVGVRGDVWISPIAEEVSVQPRVRGEYRFSDEVAIQAGMGIGQQPAVLPLPLPGLSDLPVSRGLQTAYQSDLGLSLDLTSSFHAEARGFLHRYEQLIFADLQAIPESICINGQSFEQDPRSYCLNIPRRDNISATAYGLELFFRARVDSLRVLGSYTIAEVLGEDVLGAYVTPSYDIRHVANLAFEWEPHTNWILSLRGHFRTGGVGAYNFVTISNTDIGTTPNLRFTRYEQRFPNFGRLDASISHRWDAGWSRLRVGIEWINVIPVIGEVTGISCSGEFGGRPETPCLTQGPPPYPIPNLFLRSVID